MEKNTNIITVIKIFWNCCKSCAIFCLFWCVFYVLSSFFFWFVYFYTTSDKKNCYSGCIVIIDFLLFKCLIINFCYPNNSRKNRYD